MSNFEYGTSSRVIQIRRIHQESSTESAASSSDEVRMQQKEIDAKLETAQQQLEKAQAQASQIIQDAEEKIQKEQKQWTRERASLVEDAQQEGYQEGYEKGVQQSQQEYSEKLDQANRVIDQAKEAYQSIVDSSEESIVEIALKCAEKIIHQHFEDSPDSFSHVVKQVIKEVQDQPEVTIYVHPEQYGQLANQREELQMVTDRKTDVLIYAKEDVSPYSCIIESSFGRIDASIDSQLYELRQKIFEVAHEENGHE